MSKDKWIREGYEEELEMKENIFSDTDLFCVLMYYREFKKEKPQLPELTRKDKFDELPTELAEEFDSILATVLKDEETISGMVADGSRLMATKGLNINFLLDDRMFEKALKFVTREVYFRDGRGEYTREEAGEMAKKYLPNAIEFFDAFLHRCLGMALEDVFSRCAFHNLQFDEAHVLEPKLIGIEKVDERLRAVSYMRGGYAPPFTLDLKYSAVDKRKLDKEEKKSTDSMFG